jgi:flagellar basal body-associated protein FliL
VGAPEKEASMAGRLVLLGGILAAVAVAVVGYFFWDNAADETVSIHAYIALALGVVLTLGVGGGLMALMFYSARQGYDERARYPRAKAARRRERSDDDTP